MKKFYLSLLGAMTALTVAAQQNYTVYALDPVTNEKTEQWDYIYENGKLAEEHVIYYHAEGNEETKTLYNYDDQGRLLWAADYKMRDGEYVMTYKREDTEYNQDGFIAIINFYTEDKNNPGQLVPDIKYFVYRYQGMAAVDYDMYYLNDAGAWTFYGKVWGEVNSKGEVVKLYQEQYWGDKVYVSTKLWEYDDYGWNTKITYTSDYWDDYEYTYEFFRDANGVVEKSNVYKYGQFEKTYYYVWGDPTAVQGVKVDEGTAPWYDLSGRRLSTPPTKGVYIHKGRKILAK